MFDNAIRYTFEAQIEQGHYVTQDSVNPDINILTSPPGHATICDQVLEIYLSLILYTHLRYKYMHPPYCMCNCTSSHRHVI